MNTKVNEPGGSGGTPGNGADFPAPLGEVQTRSDIHTAVHGKPAMEQAPDDLWRDHLWRGTHIKISFLVTIENPHWSSLILTDCSPWRAPMLVPGKKCEERGAAQK